MSCTIDLSITPVLHILIHVAKNYMYITQAPQLYTMTQVKSSGAKLINN